MNKKYHVIKKYKTVENPKLHNDIYIIIIHVIKSDEIISSTK